MTQLPTVPGVAFRPFRGESDYQDFARIITLFMAVRAWEVLRVALRPETATVPAPWGGVITFRAGAAVFFVVTVMALALVARAAWAETAADGEAV